MAPYLIVFSLSLILIYVASGLQRRSFGFIILSAAAILCPCLLAGFRAETVGTDVAVYAKPIFDLASHSNTFNNYYNGYWWSSWHYWGPRDIEIGYTLLTWICAHYFHSFPLFLALTSALTITPIYVSLAKYCKGQSLILSMCVFYFCYFNVSLNMMRQWIALAFTLYSIIILYKHSNNIFSLVPCFIGLLIATCFHMSALLAVYIVFIRWIFSNANYHAMNFIFIALMLLPILGLTAIGPISSVLTTMGLGRYLGYIGDGIVALMPNQIIMRLPFLFVILYCMNNSISAKRNPMSWFLLTMTTMGIICSQLTSVGANSGRIGLYFDMFNMLIPGFLFKYRKSQVANVVFWMIFITYCVVYWVYFFVIGGSSETVPYLLSHNIMW